MRTRREHDEGEPGHEVDEHEVERERGKPVDPTDPTGYWARLREQQDIPADLRWAYAFDPSAGW